MREKSLETENGSFFFQEYPDRIVITGTADAARRLVIPEQIAGRPVRGIYKKAFFNRSDLCAVSLPAALLEIGGWAFAHCVNLERVELAGRKVQMDKDPFLGCMRLKEICLPAGETSRDAGQVAPLLAAAAVRMEDPHLFSIAEAGEREWLDKWDARMLVILREPDESGFEKNVLTGEEDYASTDFERFVREKRKAKARLAYLRLLNPCGLSQDIRRELETFLQTHTKGCASEESWQVLWQEHGEEPPYYELFAALGCVTRQNLDGLLRDLQKEHPEMKAYLMRYQAETLGYSDYFSSLSLDL